MIIFYIEEKEHRKSQKEPCEYIKIHFQILKNFLNIFQDLKNPIVAAALCSLFIHSYLWCLFIIS